MKISSQIILLNWEIREIREIGEIGEIREIREIREIGEIREIHYSITESTPKSHFSHKDIFSFPPSQPSPKGEGVTLIMISNLLFFIGFLYFSPLGENERGNKIQ